MPINGHDDPYFVKGQGFHTERIDFDGGSGGGGGKVFGWIVAILVIAAVGFGLYKLGVL